MLESQQAGVVGTPERGLEVWFVDEGLVLRLNISIALGLGGT
jgi:hypothetical protein